MNRIRSLNLAIKGRNDQPLEAALLLKDKFKADVQCESLPDLINHVYAVTPEPWQRWVIALLKLARTSDPVEQFNLSLELTKSLSRIALGEDGWIVGPLNQACVQLKKYAIQCGIGEYMESCSRALNGALKATMIDPYPSKNPSKQAKNKRLGYYRIANILLSVYFRVRAFSLANGVVTSTNTQKRALVPLEELPIDQKVPWLYYSGVLKFIDQRYDLAFELLSQAFKICPNVKSQELILFYLVPLQILRHHYPSSQDFPWKRYPALAELYKPLIASIKTGNVARYRSVLSQHYGFLVSKHLYLLLLKLTEQVQIHLANRVWLATEKQDKIDLADFITIFEAMGQFEGIDPSLHLSSMQLILSGMIHSGNLMGTIFVSHGKIVLRKVNPFPHLKSRYAPPS